jgi:hypothetical protein
LIESTENKFNEKVGVMRKRATWMGDRIMGWQSRAEQRGEESGL